HVRGAFTDKPGTIIRKEDKKMEKTVVSGITYNKSEAKITILNVPDRPGIAALIFNKIADNDINVDMIIQNISQKGSTDVSFTIAAVDLKKSARVIEDIVRKIKAKGFIVDDGIAKVSIVGAGMRQHTGVAAKMFKALA